MIKIIQYLVFDHYTNDLKNKDSTKYHAIFITLRFYNQSNEE